MRIARTILTLLVLCSPVGCVSATVDIDSACSTRTLAFPGVPTPIAAVIGKQTLVQTTNLDMSKVLSKATDVGVVSLGNASLTLNTQVGNLDFVDGVEVSLHSDTLGDLVIGNATVSHDATVTTLNVPVVADRDKLLTWLGSGRVLATLTMPGSSPTQNTKVDMTLCVAVSAHVEKSTSDIGK